MASWYEWKVQCAQDLQYYKVLTKENIEPTVCPNNAAHSVVEGSGLIVDSISNKNPELDDMGEKRLLVSIGLFPDYMNPCFFSRGDNFEDGTRGNGERLLLIHPDGAPTTTITTLHIVDLIQLIGGVVRVYNGNTEDFLTVDIYAPATPVTEAPGGNTGNCNLVFIGAGNMIVPAGGDGTHNCDIESPVNPNLAGLPGQPIKVTAAVPVPALDSHSKPCGYWNWNRFNGNITPAYDGKGSYYLLDHSTILVKYVNELSVFGGMDSEFKQKLMVNHRSGAFMPHYKCRIHTTRSATHAPTDPPVIYSILMICARQFSA